MQERLPNAAVIVIKQNSHTSAWPNEAAYGASHVTRLEELGRLAVSRGWDILDIYSAFVNHPDGAAPLISADGLHPTTGAGGGYDFGGRVLLAAAGMTTELAV